MKSNSSKKFIVSFFAILAFSIYAALVRQSDFEAAPLPASGGGNASGTPPSAPAARQEPVSAAPASPAPMPMAGRSMMPMPAKQYRDGSYAGSVADAYFGPLQVSAVIKNGAIADIQFLQYPSDNGHSLRVSEIALPILRQEAIQSQNAQVDVVSGATQTSQAFQESLQSALGMAKA